MKIKGRTLLPQWEDSRTNIQASVFMCFASLASRPIRRKCVNLQGVPSESFRPKTLPHLHIAQGDGMKPTADFESRLPAHVLWVTHCLKRDQRKGVLLIAFHSQKSTLTVTHSLFVYEAFNKVLLCITLPSPFTDMSVLKSRLQFCGGALFNLTAKKTEA